MHQDKENIPEEKFSTKLHGIATQSQLLKLNPWYYLCEIPNIPFLCINLSSQYIKDHHLKLPPFKASKFKIHINIEAKSYATKIDKIFDSVMPEFFKYSLAPSRLAENTIFIQMKYEKYDKYELQHSPDMVLIESLLQLLDLIAVKKFEEATALCTEKKLQQSPAFAAPIKYLFTKIATLQIPQPDDKRAKIIAKLEQDVKFYKKQMLLSKQETERMMDGTQITIYMMDDIMEAPAKQKALKKFIASIPHEFVQNGID